MRAGESAFLAAEQFAFNEVCRKAVQLTVIIARSLRELRR
jgi:hypothetical protein